MNYEELSDFEINMAVALVLDVYYAEGEMEPVVIIKDCTHIMDADYCNNPSDAWPIITENRISLDAVEDEHDSERYWSAIAPGGSQFSAITWGSKNPLRASMIVFLKMQEDRS